MASPPHAEGQPSPRGTDPAAGGTDPPPGGVRTCGYLRKQKHGHKRFFVLREPSAGLPARLEYYESEKKWRNKSAAKRVIPLDGCLNVNKRADAKHKHLVALYTRDEYFAVAAESEPEQELWYRGLTELMSPGRADDGSRSDSASSLVGFDEASYGVITPVAAAYREVWQVVLKSKGLGQSRHLTGVYRLCLSARTISFIKLTAEVASVSLQLMNIRRCGHSDSFFFMEVGRSAATGPGELWMQADDSVVAQNIHETILEAMKAMKELSEFRPRSKSQSSGTNPISVPVRRHLNHPPPSQTGLQARRSRTDSVSATSPVSKLSSCRFRTASEGDGSTARPVSVSPLSPGVHRALLGRSKTLTARPCRTFESSSLQHSKSMSMPVSRSPPPAGGGSPSPVSLSSLPETGGGPPRPSSCSASISGSPSDAGFVSSEEWGSSPGEGRDLRLSLTLLPPRGATPPAGGDPHHGYMLMERQAQRKRTYSLTSPRQQGAPPQPSSASLDEYTLMRATYGGGPRRPLAASPKGWGGHHPEAHGEAGDAGYMPMLPGAAPRAPKGHAYMAMSPMCVSAPKQIINPRAHPASSPPRPAPCSGGGGGGSPPSLEERGYMRMWAGPRLSGDGAGDYLNMSPVDPLGSPPPPPPADPRLLSPSADPPPPRQPLWYGPPPPRGPKAGDADQYVVMSLQRQRIEEESSGGPPSSSSCSAPSPLRAPRPEGPPAPRARAPRPSRLALEALRPLPCMREDPLPAGPRSPGEYIHIAFSGPPAPGPAAPASTRSDYVNVDLGSPRGPLVAGSLSSTPAPQPGEREGGSGAAERAGQQAGPGSRGSSGPGAPDDYAPMSFNTPPPPPGPSPATAAAAAEAPPAPPPPPPPLLLLQRPGPGSPPPPGLPDAFLLGPAPAPLDPNRGAKVIRADPQGRRRHSSETFSSTTTVTPVCPSFARAAQRHSSASVENVSRSARRASGGGGSDDDEAPASSALCGVGGGSPMCRETSAGFQNGLNYIALNLMEGAGLGAGGCGGGGGGEALLRFKTACGCKGGVNGFSGGGAYAGMGFKEGVTAVKD